jgi:hypothetical protein
VHARSHVLAGNVQPLNTPYPPVLIPRPLARRLASPAYTFTLSAANIGRVAGHACVFMLVCGITSALYAAADAPRALLFAAGALGGCVLLASITLSAIRAAVLGPSGAKQGILGLWLFFCVTWAGYPVLFLLGPEGWGGDTVSAGIAGVVYGLLDLLTKNAYLLLLLRVRVRGIDAAGALWVTLASHAEVQTDPIEGLSFVHAKGVTTATVSVGGNASAGPGNGDGKSKDRPIGGVWTDSAVDLNDGPSGVAASPSASACSTALSPANGTGDTAVTVAEEAGSSTRPAGLPKLGALTARTLRPLPAHPPLEGGVVGEFDHPYATGRGGDSSDGDEDDGPVPPDAGAAGGAAADVRTYTVADVEGAIRKQMMALLKSRAAAAAAADAPDGLAAGSGKPSSKMKELFSDAELIEWSRQLAAAHSRRIPGAAGGKDSQKADSFRPGDAAGAMATARAAAALKRSSSRRAFGAGTGYRESYDAAKPVHERLFADAASRGQRLEELLDQAHMLLGAGLRGAGASGAGPLPPGSTPDENAAVAAAAAATAMRDAMLSFNYMPEEAGASPSPPRSRVRSEGAGSSAAPAPAPVSNAGRSPVSQAAGTRSRKLHGESGADATAASPVAGAAAAGYASAAAATSRPLPLGPPADTLQRTSSRSPIGRPPLEAFPAGAAAGRTLVSSRASPVLPVGAPSESAGAVGSRPGGSGVAGASPADRAALVAAGRSLLS